MDITTALEILGVGADVSRDTAKQAYWKLAKVHHPDKGGSKRRFQILKQAWELVEAHCKAQEQNKTRPASQHRPAPNTPTQTIYLVYDAESDVYLRMLLNTDAAVSWVDYQKVDVHRYVCYDPWVTSADMYLTSTDKIRIVKLGNHTAYMDELEQSAIRINP